MATPMWTDGLQLMVTVRVERNYRSHKEERKCRETSNLGCKLEGEAGCDVEIYT